MMTLTVRGAEHCYDRTHPKAFRSLSSQVPKTEALTIVFIHGWLLGRTYWQPVIAQLEQEFSCLAYDLRGFGDSHLETSQPLLSIPQSQSQSQPNPQSQPKLQSQSNPQLKPQPQSKTEPNLSSQNNLSQNNLSQNTHTQKNASQIEQSEIEQGETYSLASYAQDLEDLLNQLEIGRVWLVGHSLGGSIALWAAHRMGDRVAGVTCVNAGGGIYLKEEFEKFRAAGQQLLKFRPRWLLNLPGLDCLFARAAVYQNIGRNFGRQRLLDFLNADAIAARESLLTSTTEAEVHRLPQLLSELSQPVYFIAGRQDRIMEPRYVRHLASFHPLFQQQGKNVIELDHCGHLAMVEHPDLVAQQIHQTLQWTLQQQDEEMP